MRGSIFFLMVFSLHCSFLFATESSPHEVVLRFYEEVHNEKRLEVITDLFTADYVAYAPSGEVSATGPEGELKHMRESIAFFPNLHTEVQDVVAQGSKVVIRWLGTGTHNGKLVLLPGLSLFEIQEHKIRRAWHYYDTLHSFKQLGYTLNEPKQ